MLWALNSGPGVYVGSTSLAKLAKPPGLKEFEYHTRVHRSEGLINLNSRFGSTVTHNLHLYLPFPDNRPRQHPVVPEARDETRNMDTEHVNTAGTLCLCS